MEIETLRTMNESLTPSLLLMMEIVALIAIIFSITGLAIYLSGIAWLCFEEMRQPPRRRKQAQRSAEPVECMTPTAPGKIPSRSWTNVAASRKPAMLKASTE